MIYTGHSLVHRIYFRMFRYGYSSSTDTYFTDTDMRVRSRWQFEQCFPLNPRSDSIQLERLCGRLASHSNNEIGLPIIGNVGETVE